MTRDGLPAWSTGLETKTHSVAMLLAFIRAGRMRIPRFQRPFCWNDEDRLLLFDSLHAGYPIGTLLLATGSAPEDRVALGDYEADVPASGDALWVVDGQQRLSTLAMALLSSTSGSYRPIYFDLAAEKFTLGVRRRPPKSDWLPTHVLASSSVLSRWLRENEVADVLCDRADEISRRIREYIVPAYVVPYDGADDTLLRQIFLRINRRGRSLESHEVFDALHGTITGAQGPIERVRTSVTSLGFGTLEPKHVERCATAVVRGDPGHALEEQFTDQSAVPELFSKVESGIRRTIEFLSQSAGVPHLDLLPYEGTLFTLTRFFALHPNPHPRNIELLVRWFWRGTLNGHHAKGNAIFRRQWQKIGDDEAGSVQELLRLIEPVGEADLPAALSPFRRGTVATNMELISLAALSPKILVGMDPGTDVDVAAILNAHAPRDGIADRPDRLATSRSTIEFPFPIVDPPIPSTIASYLIHPRITEREIERMQPDAAALATHGITPAALDALRSGDVSSFLAQRSPILLNQVRRFLESVTALRVPDHDLAPLESYLADDVG